MKEAFEKHGLNPKKLDHVAKVTLTNDYLRQMTREFLARVSNIKKCESCGGRSPTLRKESNSKVFESTANKKDQASNDAQGLKKRSLFAEKAALASKKAAGAAAAAASKNVDTDSDADDSNDEEDEEPAVVQIRAQGRFLIR